MLAKTRRPIRARWLMLGLVMFFSYAELNLEIDVTIRPLRLHAVATMADPHPPPDRIAQTCQLPMWSKL